MKLAILGSSSMALEAALRFHTHGAALTWFNYPESGTDYNGTTDLGLGLLSSINKPTTIKDWNKDYALPLTQLLMAQQSVRTHEVVSITKRYLALGEVPKNSSRFADLFRVTFLVNPTEFIEQQKETSPETFARLTEEVMNSLQSNLEMYEDFDLVLDLRSKEEVPSISVSGRAMGETRVSKDALVSGHAALTAAMNLSLHHDAAREIALIGSTPLAAEILLTLEDWLKDPRSRLFVTTHEEDPFHAFLSAATPQKREALQSLFKYFHDEFEAETTEFHHKLREWQALDDFVQAKKPKPAEPIPRLVFFSGHNVTAVDQLIDRKRLFLTLEKPEFRHGVKQPENNLLDLKTIGADLVLSANEPRKKSIFLAVDVNEKGFFCETPTWKDYSRAWESDQQKLKGIEDEIFKLFSATDSH